MSEFLPSNLEFLGEDSSKWAAECSNIEKMKDGVTEKGIGEDEEEMVSSAHLEPATLQWQGDRDREKVLGNRSAPRNGDNEQKRDVDDEAEGERRSVRSECLSFRGGGESRTESEREMGSGAEKRRTRDGWMELEREREDEGLRNRGKKEQTEIEVEEEGGGREEMNSLPEKAAQVFNPAVTILHSSSLPASPRESEAFWDVETEKSPFLDPHRTPPDGYYHDWPLEGGSSKCGCDCANRNVLKAGVSLFTAALIFPLLVWGGYVFLPFDAPLLNTTPLRLVYTLRCSVFAMVPIILGWTVLGVSRLRTGVVKPLCEGEEEAREVSIHRRYVDDSVSLFLLYFLQLAVMAAYLSQDLLKLVPLLTVIFAFGRLVYWVAAALGSSVRGFGFGLSFLPTMAMLAANLYFIFAMEAGGTIFAQEGRTHQEPPPGTRQRFWG